MHSLCEGGCVSIVNVQCELKKNINSLDARLLMRNKLRKADEPQPTFSIEYSLRLPLQNFLNAHITWPILLWGNLIILHDLGALYLS